MEKLNNFNLLGNLKNVSKKNIFRLVIAWVLGIVAGNADIGCIRFDNSATDGLSKSNSLFEINCDKIPIPQEGTDGKL